MLNCIKKIENYILDLSYEEFTKDEKTKDAVIRNLEVLGKAANQIPKNIQENYKRHILTTNYKHKDIISNILGCIKGLSPTKYNFSITISFA